LANIPCTSFISDDTKVKWKILARGLMPKLRVFFYFHNPISTEKCTSYV
jgi:hypothetical protein